MPFIATYAIFLSLGIECLLLLLSKVMALFDSSSFSHAEVLCLIVGLLSLIALIATIIIDLKVSERLGFTKKIWWMQIIVGITASIPMVKLWETLFDGLYFN